MDGFNKAAEGFCSGNFEAFNAMRKVYLGDTPDGSRVFYAFPAAVSLNQQLVESQIFIFDRQSYAQQCGNMKYMLRNDPSLGDHQKVIDDKLLKAILDEGELTHNPPGQSNPGSLAHTWETGGKEPLLVFADKDAVKPLLEFVDPPKAVV